MRETILCALKDFKELSDLNLISKRCTSILDLENYLSEELQKELIKVNDIEKAYDNLDIKYLNYLSRYFVCINTNREWRINSVKISKEEEDYLTEQWNNYHTDNLSSLEQLTKAIEHKVYSTNNSSNEDTLTIICGEVFKEYHPFFVDEVKSTPCLSFMD